RAVDDGPVGARESHPLSLRARVEALASLHHAGFRQLLVELPHLGEKLLARHLARFRLLACFHKYHHSHLLSPFVALWPGRMSRREIDTARTTAGGWRCLAAPASALVEFSSCLASPGGERQRRWEAQ